MKITQLDIKGFRSLKDVTWQPGDLNLLIGANGAGKSNLLRFLELLAVSARGGLGKYIQSLGGFNAIAWDGSVRDISWALNYADSVFHHDRYEVKLTGGGWGYRVATELLSGNPSEEETVIFIDREGNKAKISDFMFEVPRELNPELIDKEGTLLSAASAFHDWSDVALFKSALSSITVYHDIRVDRDAAIRSPAVTRYEQRVDSDGQNLISVLHTLYTGNREFKRDIDAAMRAAFGDDYEEIVFPPAADQRIQLRVRWRSLKREQSAADLSDGTLRFLLLMTVLAGPDPPPVIAIDEPETGLHPAMLPIVAEHAVDAALRSQVVLSTHSPQLLDAFTETQPTTTVIRWENGETVLQNLDGEELRYWLREYTLGALFKSGELEQMG
ncbi:MAG: AAA family ATPase [Pyrinomonadaceae bacterium]